MKPQLTVFGAGRRQPPSVLVCAATLMLAAFAPVPVTACPFCNGVTLTLTEQLGAADSAVLVKWKSGTPAKLSDAGSTEFEVVDIVHQQAARKLQKGSRFNLVRYRSAKSGDLFLLLGLLSGETIEWGSPIEVTQAGYDYMKNSPKPDRPASKRLTYFLHYLEHPDRMIAEDSFGEFANAAYEDVVQLKAQLPRDKLRTWLNSKSVSQGHVALYGMLLGLCGTDDDARLLERKILETPDDIRLGIDGLMGGYLLLTGEKGLAVLEEAKLRNKQAEFTETYAAMQALRFMWQYGDNRIEPDRLRQSMRILLDRPEMVDIVIVDLARWKDWSVHDPLMSLYEADGFNTPTIKRAIVRFMLVATRDTGIKKVDAGAASGSSAETVVAADVPAHVVKAQEALEKLEKRDPKTVREAKRFFVK